MITQLPLVLYTVFAQLAAGTALFSTLRTLWGSGQSPRGWILAAVSAAVALLAGIFARDSLSSYIMLASLTACFILCLCSICSLRKFSFWSSAACLAGTLCVLFQASSAVPGNLFSPSGLFPYALFFLSAGTLGASVTQLYWLDEPNDKAIRYGRFYLPLRFCLWVSLFITAIAPCISWEDPFMKKSAFYWMQTQLYWVGVIFSGVAIGLSHMGRITLILQAAVSFISVVSLRLAFYADSVHGAIDLGTFYLR